MKKTAVLAFLSAFVISCATDLDESAIESAVTNTAVSLSCGQGQSSGAQGVYGGVSFAIDCRSKKTTTVILQNTVGTDWEVRVGVTSGQGSADCFFTSDPTSFFYATLPASCVGTVFNAQ